MASEAQIVLAQPIHRDGILHVIKTFYTKSEPFQVAMNIQWSEVSDYWSRIVDGCLREPYSHVLAAENGEVVGIRLSRVIDPRTHGDKSIYEWLDDGEVKKIADKLTEQWPSILKSVDGKVLQFMILCVDPRFGGKGYAVRMSEENIENAKRRAGCTYSTVRASNWMSQSVFEKMGFQVLNQFEFSTLLDKNGKRLVNIDDPRQKGVKWYGMKI